MLDEAIDELLDGIEDEDCNAQEFFERSQRVLEFAPDNPAEVNAVLPELVDSLYECKRLFRASLIARVCHLLVEEHGGDPQLIEAGVLKHLPDALGGSHQFLDFAFEEMSEEEAEQYLESGDMPDRLYAICSESEELKDPWQAYESLRFFWPSCVLVLSLSQEAREEYTPLLALLLPLANVHPAGHWLSNLLLVLDDDPVLILEPASGKGFEGTISGISDNFQLHMLLMAELIGNPAQGFLEGTPLPPQQADLARGLGEQSLDDAVSGQWNLYDWTAVQPDGTLPDSTDMESQDSWIWGEGTPADILTFDDYRVILLGPAAYQRSWGANRTFERLRAELNVTRHLDETEVKEWLQKMAVAPRPDPEEDEDFDEDMFEMEFDDENFDDEEE